MAKGRNRPLTDEEKAYMQQRRVEARREKEEAKKVLQENPQFIRGTFWKSVDPDLANAVSEAIRQAQRDVKRDEIRRLEKKIEALREDI